MGDGIIQLPLGCQVPAVFLPLGFLITYADHLHAGLLQDDIHRVIGDPWVSVLNDLSERFRGSLIYPAFRPLEDFSGDIDSQRTVDDGNVIRLDQTIT